MKVQDSLVLPEGKKPVSLWRKVCVLRWGRGSVFSWPLDTWAFVHNNHNVLFFAQRSITLLIIVINLRI